MRSNELFTRNAFYGSGIYEIPIIEKQEIKLNHIELISFSIFKIALHFLFVNIFLLFFDKF